MNITRNVRAESFSVTLSDEEIKKILIDYVRTVVNRVDEEKGDENVVFKGETYLLSATVTIVTAL